MSVVVITGREQMLDLQRRTLRRALSMKVKTGMNLPRFSPTVIGRRMGYSGRTAAAMLKDFDRRHPEIAAQQQ